MDDQQSQPFDVDPDAPGPPAQSNAAPEPVEPLTLEKMEKLFREVEDGQCRDMVLDPDEIDVLFHGLDQGIAANAIADPPVADALRQIKRKLKFIINLFNRAYGKD